MAKDWDSVVKRIGRCSKCEREFAEHQEYYACLREGEQDFERDDYCLDCWDDKLREESFSFWKAKIPSKEEKKKLLVDNEILIDFFKKLIESGDESKQGFTFVLSLILMRKRILKYVETQYGNDGREIWIMKLAKEEKEYNVINPHLDDEQIERVREELSSILAGD